MTCHRGSNEQATDSVHRRGPVSAATTPIEPTFYETRSLGRGLALLRIFFGVILFSNGLSKLFNFTDISLGPYSGNLVDRDLARTILENETARSRLPFLESVVENVMLSHWGIVQWLITGMELGVGALLIVGLATRAAALLDLGQQLFLAAVYFSSNRWVFEQPHEYIPLLILALVPAGRVWGLDGRLIRKQPGWRHWPF